jgi:hypothetical protein
LNMPDTLRAARGVAVAETSDLAERLQ